ncbi:EAL domain-containing protein [uncultured Ruminococcus sp.]|uniref:EAL domain-containing protein n=1 Tax=uncultured Ruminococcus sp. TaxID=165186 RepID=UPI0025EFE8E3|nr:EAL domain-containing protein [uncultured Ruminococcus sp.]
MDRQKTVLVIDDSAMNRSILCEILCQEYTIVEAENGVQALKMLKNAKSKVDAIILDILIPEMGGYEFMECMKKDNRFAQIPVIILTEKADRASERKALENGAWDFVSKPYDAEIVKLRLKNVIARSQVSLLKELNHVMNYDPLTGVYSKNKFFSASKTLLTSNPDKKFAFLRLDIDRFKLINSFFGNVGGDKLIKYMAKHIRDFAKTTECCTFGRIDADVFGIFTPYQGKEHTIEQIEQAVSRMKALTPNYNIMLVYGVYIVTDRELPISQMCDRAALAAKTVKGHYMKNYAFYDDKMRLSLENEQNIINEMSDALENHEFVPYYQPKYDVKTNKPVGAEALARWIHPTKGFISPGVFIPIFEKNGFISKLDLYIWECVCKQLKEWKDRGVPLFPVSVNVSRVNLYNPNLSKIIIELTKKYDVDPKYFNIEITESVYTDKNILIDEMTNQLRSNGFTILMDDFGSGYSSLNVLKDIQVDVLKMDMMFMFKAKYEGRAETIISSVIRMAKWLNIPVIAEGVDKAEQVDFLRSVGCDFIQGFYFAKPMPAKDYEKLISEQEEFAVSETRSSANGLLWGNNSGLAVSIDDIDQPAMILECFPNDNIEAVSSNKAFIRAYGFDSSMYGKFNVVNCIDEGYKELYTSTIRKVIENKGRADCVFSMHDINGKKLWFSTHFRYISETDISTVIVAYITDVTDMVFMDQRINDYKDYVKNETERRHNVLVVSGDEEARKELDRILSQNNDVFTADSVENGKKQLSEHEIDLVYFDIELISENEAFPLDVDGKKLPVIAIIPSHDEFSRRAVLKQRVSDFVMKPFIDEIVRSRTANLLKIGITGVANEKFFSRLK